MYRCVLRGSVPNRENEDSGHIFHEYQDEDHIIIDKFSKYRGVFIGKYDFVVTYLLVSIGIGNLKIFPISVYLYGGSAFMVFYLFLSIGCGIPMFILETGLCQFYSVGESKLFTTVPYFRGLGWGIHILNLILFIPYSINIQWFLTYLLYTMAPMASPWSFCIEIPGTVCRDLFHKAPNNSLNEMSPSLMFLEFEVKGSRRMSDSSLYDFNDALDGVRGLQFMLIVVVWILITMLTLLISNMYMTFVRSLLKAAVAILVLLTLKSLIYTGSFRGVGKFLNPNFDRLFTGESLREALTQVMFSLCIAKSCSAFASLNSFKFDFLKASFLILLWDFWFCCISGMLVFATLGYLSYKLDTNVDILIKRDIIFVNLIDASVLKSEMKIWVFLLMVMMIILGVTSVSSVCSSFIISFIDFFPDFMNRSENKKTLVSICLCSFLCFLSLFYSANGSVIYLNLFTQPINDISAPLMIFSEVVFFQFIYGVKRLRLEMKMMLGYTYNVIWIFFSMTLVPILILFLLMYSIYKESQIVAPLWADFVIFFVTILPLLPVVISFLKQLCYNYKTFNGIEIFKVGLRTPKIFGPYYKRNWLLSRYYQKKLVKNRKNPEFLELIPKTENLQDILDSLKRMYFQGTTSRVETAMLESKNSSEEK